MASVVDQRRFAERAFASFGQATDLKKRLWFTLGALIVYRLGTYIPLPGIDPIALKELFDQQQGGILGMFNMFSGGALSRMTVFALNILPYISSSIIMQLLAASVPSLEQLKKEGEAGRRKITQYTRYGTVLLAALQGYGIAVGLESSGGIVLDPGVFFRVSTVVSIVGGTMFLMWLGEQITQRGVGNGISLIIFSGIVANLPIALAGTLELGRTGALSAAFLLLLAVMIIAVIVVIVFVERAQRRLVVHYPKRQRGARMTGGESTHLPLKLNTSGVIPPIFASSILLMPLTFANLNLGNEQGGTLALLAALLGRGQPLFLFLYGALILFFAFFYTAIVFNPQDTAENLRKQGGIIQGIRPGAHTADYLDFVLTRLTVFGGLYLVAVSLLPEILISRFAVPFYFGGTSLLIVVSVTMDTVAQIQGHLMSYRYENLMRRSGFHKLRR